VAAPEWGMTRCPAAKVRLALPDLAQGIFLKAIDHFGFWTACVQELSEIISWDALFGGECNWE
jgi:hypothetical protein